MGALLVLAGTLLLMWSSIWVIGEALKQDVLLGALALLVFPIYSAYYTFFVNYKKGSSPFYLGLGGMSLVFIGYFTGI